MPRYLVTRETGAAATQQVDEEQTEIWCVVIDGNAAGCVIWAHPSTGTEFDRHYSMFEAPTPRAIDRAAANARLGEQHFADALRLETRRHR